MSALPEQERAEREWVAAHFDDYFLGRLDWADVERLTIAVATLPGLIDDFEDAEAALIESYLDERLPAEERSHFERQYAQGNDEDNQAKLRLHQALRLPEMRRKLDPAPPLPFRRPGVRTLAWTAAIAASIVAIVFGALYQQQSHRLSEALAALKERPHQAPPGPPVPRGVTPPENSPEQPAGLTPEGGLTLPVPGRGTTVVRVSGQLATLIWPHVPDYRKHYRIRIDAASGEESASGPLTPQDNAIAFSPPQAAKFALPWDVFVLTANEAGAKVLAHYLLVQP